MALVAAVRESILAALFNGGALIQVVGPTTIHLHTGDPGATGDQNEVSTSDWANYEPQAVHDDLETEPYWSAPADAGGHSSQVVNAQPVTFGEVQLLNQITITHYTVRDSDDPSKLLDMDVIRSPNTGNPSPKTLNNEDPVSFPAGTFRIRLAVPE